METRYEISNLNSKIFLPFDVNTAIFSQQNVNIRPIIWKEEKAEEFR